MQKNFDEEKYLDLLKSLVAIYSPSTNEAEASKFLVQQMKEMGYDKAYIDEAGNPIGEWGTGKESVVLLGHIDTVPGIVDIKTENGMFYGRGSVDAKGPLCCYVSAVSMQEKIHDKKIVVIGAVEEEIESSKGANHVKDKYRPDYFINGEPSSWDCITLGYKGRLMVDYAIQKGISHGASPESSAGELAIAVYNSLSHYCDSFNEGKKIFERLDSRLHNFHTEDDGLYESAKFKRSFRLPLGFDFEGFKDYLVKVNEDISQGQGKMTWTGHEVAYKGKKNSPLVRSFLRAIRKFDAEPKFKVKTGTSDLNVLAPIWDCPSLAYGPGDSSLDHTPNEHISLDEYLKSIHVLSDVLSSLQN